MEQVGWHLKRGNWWLKAGIVGVLCACFYLSVMAFASVLPTIALLLVIILYTWGLKYYEHCASIQVEVLKNHATQYQLDKAYTEARLEETLDGILYRKIDAGDVEGHVRNHELRLLYRKEAENLLNEKAEESKEAYFKQITRLEAMGYTQQEIQAFHNLTYQYAETDYGSTWNVFMFRIQDSKSERIIKWLTGLAFTAFWGVELYTFISDNSPFIQLVKFSLVCVVLGLVWGSILQLKGYNPNERSYTECGSCGNMYTGAFCGCFWATYLYWKK